MQSFRERSGFHGNQPPCYPQQEPHELSRLESYRQHPPSQHPHPHHPQPHHPLPHPHPGPSPHPAHASRQGYESHALPATTGMPPAGAGAGTGAAGTGPKDCYSQQAYPGYPGSGGGGGGPNAGGAGGPTAPQAKKPYRGSKVAPPPPNQHLQAGGYSNHMGPGGVYTAQYMSEGHLQQKWEDPDTLAQYEQEMVGRLEPGQPGSSQYLDQTMLGHSQSQCHLPPQPSNPVYTSPHHQPHPPNPAPSPLMYPQSHLHYPQHSPSPSPSSSYMEKCSPMPHCYKGYSMPPNSQYARQMGGHGGLKQGGYRPQNSYSYQQPPSRGGYDPQPPLQGMPPSQEGHPKYQLYSQPQQNYCLSELSVRSPEQYYQTCSPSSSHSPARSVGRSPSYSSTPSPLMTNPESFQYGQPPMTPGAASSSSSSSAGLQEQGMLLPPRSHPSPNLPHPAPHSYSAPTPPSSASSSASMKERFSEKLLSNPSLWSLNALTSQVENISNNVQQLLLSEALVANKKGGKRSSGGSSGSSSGGSSKKGEEYKSPPCLDTQHGGGHGGPMPDPYSTPQHQQVPMELQEGGYSSSSDDQLDRGYYYCGQGRSPAQASNNTHLGLDTASSCSMTSPDDMSTRSGDSGLHGGVSRDNLTPDPRSQGGHGGDGMSTPVKSVGDERSPASVTIPSPLKQERDSPPDIQRLGEPLKENFEESAWTEKMADEEENESVKKTPDEERDCRSMEAANVTQKLEKWPEDEKGPALYNKINQAVTEKSYCYQESAYPGLQNKYEPDEGDSVEKSPGLSDSSRKGDLTAEMKSEAFKSESPTDSESSVKTSPFISRGDLDQDQYLTEKEDSSENASPTPQGDASDESVSEKRESQGEEEEEEEEDEEEVDAQQRPPLPPKPPAEVREESESLLSSTDEGMNNRITPGESTGEFCSRTEGQSVEPHTNTDPAETAAHPDAAATDAAAPSERRSAMGDIVPQPQSAMPVFSALNDTTTPSAQSREHIDRSDAKVLEPDSPQLPGKSILHSAPSWADTPPSPKKGDEDMEPGISCPRAVTPSAKPEPLAPSAQPRAYGRKHARGRRRLMHSGVGVRGQLSLGREGAPSPPQKPCMASSKSALFSDQMDSAHQDAIITSETSTLLAEGFRSRMCTRSFNAQDVSPKDHTHIKRKPGPKPGPKPGSKPGPKPGSKPGPKVGLKPGPKPGPKPGLKSGTKPGPKPGPKPGLKPGPKTGSKPGPKTGSKPGPKTGPKQGLKLVEDVLASDVVPPKAPVGRPRGSASKLKVIQQEGPIQPLTGGSGRGKKSLIANVQQAEENQDVKPTGKDSKNMVLRSRKPSRDKLSKEKEKEQEEDVLPPTLIELKQASVCLKANEHANVEQNLAVVPNETDISITLPDRPEHKTLLPLKRKASPEPPLAPLKKKRGPKPKPKPKPKAPQPSEGPLQTNHFPTKPKEVGARGPKKKQKPSQQLQTSLLSKDSPLPGGDSATTVDIPATPTQCLTKTKYLPPRKGRGQKYEAMVQKITSPGSKKHQPTPQPPENVLVEEMTSKIVPQHVCTDNESSVCENRPEVVPREVRPDEVRQEGVREEGERQYVWHSKEKKGQIVMEAEVRQDATRQEEVKPEGARQEGVRHQEEAGRQEELKPEGVRLGESRTEGVRQEEVRDGDSAGVPDRSGAKPTRTKRRKWALVESADATVVAMETGSLIINTPRLAKQRAIKNNHEMHLKQKRKRRKGQTSEDEKAQVTTELETDAETAAPAEASLLVCPGDIAHPSQVVAMEASVAQPKRGRKPSSASSGNAVAPSKKKRGRAASEQTGKPGKVHKKPGPKPGMKDAMDVIEAVVRAAGTEQMLKEEQMKKADSTVFEAVDQESPVVQVSSNPAQNKLMSSFCPYVRIDSSSTFSALCTIVNRPEEEEIHQHTKTSPARIKTPATLDAKAIQRTSAMLQGPLVNRTLIDRCLTCCLCGKPANYRELGDLCGPYYPEDSIPRKTLSARHINPTRENTEKTTSATISADPANEPTTSAPKRETEADSKMGMVEGSKEPVPVVEISSDGHHHHHHPWRPRRAERGERAPGMGGSRRLTLRERFRRMQQLQDRLHGDGTAPLSGLEGNGNSLLQRLQGEAEAKEHWAHENCTIWTNGVIMVAGRLFGLKEAASTSAQTSCSNCQGVGASISCCLKGCPHKYHYVCAKEIGCTFQEEDFSLTCPKHEAV
ncbi:retinoic acid-induced protein 1 [Osmerus eperlanus]|uniref:retinoic acid-induced protein 1 n=1 Tax=Osmerus eperlanus TaxID=29151 RepID=UPI002E141C6E